jgi:NAD(P)-dependent dehydrogenase (short-subunit alcohol dehydrogenase family)
MLKEKIAIVTGGAQGIGKAVAIAMAKEGAHVIIMDIIDTVATETVNEISNLGLKAEFAHADVTNKYEIDLAIQDIVKNHGRIDILANCAGIVVAYRLADLPVDVWDKIMDVNLKGLFMISQAVANIMMKQKYGRVVNIASMVGKVGEAGNGCYCISKAAVIMLTQIMGLELAEYGITVNSVCPGFVNTDIMQQVFKNRGPLMGKTPEEYENELVGSIPLGRMAEPYEIADLMVFLASNKAGYITGSSYTIAGGKLLV